MLFTEGGERYGPPNSVGATVAALLTAGRWTTASNATLVSQTGFPGTAISLSTGSVVKTLAANHSHLTGGLRFAGSLTNQSVLMMFQDVGTAQSCITLETTGIISLRSGGAASSVLNSGASISANSVHYLEWDITFGASGAYEIWLDGVSLFSGTGDTAAGTANDYANQIVIAHSLTGALTFRDLYLDTSFVANTNPKIRTDRPTGDSTVAFSFGAAILGQAYSATAMTNAPGANTLFLRKFTPTASGTLNSVACVPQTSTGAKYRAVVYSDSSGTPSALLSSGNEVVGTTAATTLTGTLVTPQALTGGAPYWIGFVTDTSALLALVDATATGMKATNTYSSGAPSSAPSMTVGQSSWQIYGNMIGVATRWPEVSNNPPAGDLSYAASSTVNNQDLYSFPSIGSPDFVYCVAIGSNMRKSDTGVRTVDLRLKSGATTDSGSVTGQSPLTSYAWFDSYYDQDPDTSMDWDAAGVNAATAGQKIIS